MNRSYSKIRHIQEVNQRLEKRFIVEQNEQSFQKMIQPYLDDTVNSLIKQGYKVVPKFELADGDYDLTGAGYVCKLSKDGKDTGFVYVTTGGIRGLWDGNTVRVVGGQIPKILYGEVYKILSKPVTPNK
jgi:hypothetical protein